MGKWLDLAAQLEAGSGTRDNRDIRDNSLGLTPNVSIVPNVLAPLPASVIDGVNLLQKMPAPRLLRPDAWPIAVADAVKLACDGWAANALALGWSPLQIFGAITDPEGDPFGDGLVVWLAGRKLLAISDATATVEDGNGFAFYHLHDLSGARLLWEIK